MPKVHLKQNDMTHGVINEALQSRTDLAIYTKSMSELTNMVVLPEGGIRTRFGTESVDWGATPEELDGAANTEAIFSWDTQGDTIYFYQLDGLPNLELRAFLFSSDVAPEELTVTGLPAEPAEIYDWTPVGNELWMATSNGIYIAGYTTGTPTINIRKYITSGGVVPVASPQFDLLTSFFDGYSQLYFTCTDVTDTIITIDIWSDAAHTIAATYADFGTNVDQYLFIGGMFYSFGLAASDGSDVGLGRGVIANINVAVGTFNLLVIVQAAFAPTSSTDPSRDWDGTAVVITSPVGMNTDGLGNVNANGVFHNISFFEDRLWFGNLLRTDPVTQEKIDPPYLPRTVFFSQIGSPYSFDTDNGSDSGAITITLSSDQDTTPISYLASQKSAVVFTQTSMYASSAWSSDPFTPGNSSIRLQVNHGTKVRPVIFDQSLLFLDSLGSKLFAALPNEDAQTYRVAQLNELATDLFVGEPKWLCPVQFGLFNADDLFASQILLISTSEKLILMQSLKEQNVTAFSTVEMNGETTIEHATFGSQGTFFRSRVEPAAQPAIYLWTFPSWDYALDGFVNATGVTGTNLNNYISARQGCAINKVDSPTTEYGQVLHYGPSDDEPDDPIPVAPEGYTDFIAGIRFPVVAETLPVHVNTQTGDNLYLRKRIIYTYVQTLNSAGFEINGEQVDSFLYPLVLADAAPATDTRPYTSTLYRVPTFEGWKRFCTTTILTDEPFPIHIIGMAFDMTV